MVLVIVLLRKTRFVQHVAMVLVVALLFHNFRLQPGSPATTIRLVSYLSLAQLFRILTAHNKSICFRKEEANSPAKIDVPKMMMNKSFLLLAACVLSVDAGKASSYLWKRLQKKKNAASQAHDVKTKNINVRGRALQESETCETTEVDGVVGTACVCCETCDVDETCGFAYFVSWLFPDGTAGLWAKTSERHFASEVMGSQLFPVLVKWMKGKL